MKTITAGMFTEFLATTHSFSKCVREEAWVNSGKKGPIYLELCKNSRTLQNGEVFSNALLCFNLALSKSRAKRIFCQLVENAAAFVSTLNGQELATHFVRDNLFDKDGKHLENNHRNKVLMCMRFVDPTVSIDYQIRQMKQKGEWDTDFDKALQR